MRNAASFRDRPLKTYTHDLERFGQALTRNPMILWVSLLLVNVSGADGGVCWGEDGVKSSRG